MAQIDYFGKHIVSQKAVRALAHNELLDELVHCELLVAGQLADDKNPSKVLLGSQQRLQAEALRRMERSDD